MTIELIYEGSFTLERRQGADRIAYGGHAMSLSRGGTHLWIAGHAHRDRIAEVEIPDLGGRAPIVSEFRDPAPATIEERRVFGLDTLGGIAIRGDRLYSVWNRYYAVDAQIDAPSLAWMDLTLDGMDSETLSHIGPIATPWTPKATSGYLASDAAGLLFCGRGDGAGNASSPHGPALFSFAREDPASAMVIRYRGKSAAPSWWNPVDHWSGLALIDESYVFCGAKGLGEAWYGTAVGPNGKIDPYDKSKGYHVERREVQLLVWSRGRITEPDPDQVIVLSEFHAATQVRSMAYDPERRRLYIFEHWPMEQEGSTFPGEDPRVHVYSVKKRKPLSEEPPKPQREFRATLDIDGIGRFSGTLVFE